MGVVNTPCSGVGSRATAYRILTVAFLSCTVSRIKQGTQQETWKSPTLSPRLMHDTVLDDKARGAPLWKLDVSAPRLVQLSMTIVVYVVMHETKLPSVALSIQNGYISIAAACSNRLMRSRTYSSTVCTFSYASVSDVNKRSLDLDTLVSVMHSYLFPCSTLCSSWAQDYNQAQHERNILHRVLHEPIHPTPHSRQAMGRY